MDNTISNQPNSSRLYAALVALYPRHYRDRFGAEMIQTHQDQCREALHSTHPFPAYFILWMRTLVDWITSVLREHLTDPHRTTGLLEAPPDAPMPWKGVLLVLLPGLLFFIAQIGQLTGVDWFFYLVYRGAYFLMIPVLIIWVWKKRFPVWGLMPVGLLIKTVVDFFYDTYRSQTFVGTIATALYKLFPGNPFLLNLLVHSQRFDMIGSTEQFSNWLVAILWVGAFVLLILARWNRPRFWQSVSAFGGFLVLALAASAVVDFQYIQALLPGSVTVIPREDAIQTLKWDVIYGMYVSGTFMLSVMLGSLFSRRHGRVALLLPMGYLLSSTIYGRLSNDWPVGAPDAYNFMITVAVVALIYRFTVALAGPLWIARSASSKTRTRAGGISLVLLVLLQLGFNLWQIRTTWGGEYFWTTFFWQTRWQLVFLIGVLMAVKIYEKEPISLARPDAQQKTSVPVSG